MKPINAIIVVSLFALCMIGMRPVAAKVNPEDNFHTYLPLVSRPIIPTSFAKQKLAVGVSFSCAITPTGGVKCWGMNAVGNLGIGTTDPQNNGPVSVVGMGAPVVSIEAKRWHACALTSKGGVKCWGENQNGVLGDATTTDRFAPVFVTGLTSGIKAITVGDYHACAITDMGGVLCWGANESGQLGDGTTNERHIPGDVIGLSTGVTAISAGLSHTCALTTTGVVKCWGATYGFGEGIPAVHLTPENVIGLPPDVISISSGGGFSCAVTAAHGAKCWGVNAGRLGDGTDIDRMSPVDVFGLQSSVASISAGSTNSCAVTTSGAAKCWGWNLYGSIGDGTTYEKLEPTNVVGLSSGVVEITTNRSNTCAMLKNGTVKCWGLNFDGQVGTGSDKIPYYTTPVSVIKFP